MYDPRYPVCMHVYGALIGDRMDCIFASLDQCQAAAMGLPATCLTLITRQVSRQDRCALTGER
ncbi:DUF3551 domain-containing protein [Bradyrhizobium septentrionale]|uniref:DUF3551 domain-containing protein n=1 Tax=Bradyrhizobium septentrionale TaxID=1404411 RepID=UPI0030CAC0B9